MGHAILNLADEYEAGTCDTTDKAANLSSSASLDQIPWSDLVNTKELPTLDQSPNVVGAFEGAGYCTRGLYRPAHDCLMRSLGIKMCPVCRRELDRFFATSNQGKSVGCDKPSCSDGQADGGSGASVGVGATPTGSCAVSCGSSSVVPGSSPGCYCDSNCSAYGDCCPDIAICDQPAAATASCAGHCGSSEPVPDSSPNCYCDDLCVQSGDCCPDVATECTTTSAAPSCQDHCGSSDPLPGSSPACYCDAACIEYGDCCEDANVCSA
jgi:hypothetical protein